MKTERYAPDMIRVSALVLGIILSFELISELENFSRCGERGVIMRTTKAVTGPVGELFRISITKQYTGRDLDFPPGSESIEQSRLYADTVILLKMNK